MSGIYPGHKSILICGPLLHLCSRPKTYNKFNQNIQIHNGTAKYDLLLQLAETSEGLVGHFEYRTDLFKVNTIKRMVEHLKTLLTEIVANPKESISRLSILSPLEKNQLLIQWNKSDLGISIYELFTLISNRVIRKYV